MAKKRFLSFRNSDLRRFPRLLFLWNPRFQIDAATDCGFELRGAWLLSGTVAEDQLAVFFRVETVILLAFSRAGDHVPLERHEGTVQKWVAVLRLFAIAIRLS